MFDDNHLSDSLKAFEEKNAFEVFAMLYVYILFGVEKLDDEMSKTELKVPAWITGFSFKAQEVKEAFGFCQEEIEVLKFDLITRDKLDDFELLTREEQDEVANEFNSRAKQYSTALKVLCHCQVQADASSLCIADELNKQVSLLISKAKDDNIFFITETLPKAGELLNELLPTYVVAGSSESQYPVLEALVRWGVHNADSLISKLLNDSKRWVKKKHHVTAEENKKQSIRKEDGVFFHYLNYNSKDV